MLITILVDGKYNDESGKAWARKAGDLHTCGTMYGQVLIKHNLAFAGRMASPAKVEETKPEPEAKPKRRGRKKKNEQ